MAKTFISYTRDSEATARNLASDIEALGHEAWFDQELSGGQAWWDQILARVRTCDVFVFLLDPKSLNSAACQREFGYADALGKPILPVLIAEGVSANLLPPELSRIQFIDYRKQDRNAAFGLARALGSMPASKPLPDPLPDPPEVPISYLGGLASRVATPAFLNYEAQGALLLDIKRGLKDPEAAEDSRTLLRKLRSRRDLFAAVAEEIDELLGGVKRPAAEAPQAVTATQAAPAPIRDVAPLPVPEPFREAEHPVPVEKPGETALEAASPRGTKEGAILGALLGALIGGLAAYNAEPASWFIGAGIDGAAGAIVGSVTGTRRKVVVVALVGLVLGSLFWWIVDSEKQFAFVRAMVVGAPAGAILAAIVGVILRRKKA